MNEPKIGAGRFLAALAAALAVISSAWALEPPTKEQVERYRKDGTLAARAAQARTYGNHRIAPRLAARTVERFRGLSRVRRAAESGRPALRTAAPPAGWAGMPTRGTVKVLALLIAFADQPPVTPAESVAARLFGDGEGGFPFESLRNYYRRSSYGQLEIQGDVLGWYTTSYPRSSVTETDSGRESLIEEALMSYYLQGHDFSQYDNDGDGAIDYFCVFWSGPHGEWASFWWGYYTGMMDSSFRLDGKRLGQYSWQWELPNYPYGDFSPTTVIHETGHALGVPDYYDYDPFVGPPGGVGGLDIMDGTAGDHNCFSKFMLDWITPTVVDAGSRTVTLRASGDTGDALLFFPNAAPDKIFDEYFMVQNRCRTANDTGLFTGTDGLLVWHADARLDSWNWDYLYDNSYTEHKLLKLVQADGLEHIENLVSWAEAGDYYIPGGAFGPATLPASDRYGGLPTGMGFWNITGTGTTISLDVFAGDAPPTCAITSLTNGQTVYGTIAVAVAAGDDNGVGRVDLFVDGVLKGADSTEPFEIELDTKALANGPRVFKATAYDTILQKTSSNVVVTVENIYAPAGLAVSRVVNRGLLLSEFIDVVTWRDNAANIDITKYRVYVGTGADRALLAEVDKASGTAASYRYLRRRVDGSQSYTYTLAAVGGQGREGEAAVATVR